MQTARGLDGCTSCGSEAGGAVQKGQLRVRAPTPPPPRAPARSTARLFSTPHFSTSAELTHKPNSSLLQERRGGKEKKEKKKNIKKKSQLKDILRGAEMAAALPKPSGVLRDNSSNHLQTSSKMQHH